MFNSHSHISDEDLLLFEDGALANRRISKIRAHLEICEACCLRLNLLKQTNASFVCAYRGNMDSRSADLASRALFIRRLKELARKNSTGEGRNPFRFTPFPRRIAYVTGTCALVFVSMIIWQSRRPSLALSPNPSLTPGATLPVSQADICMERPESESRLVLASVGKRIFEEYGIRNPQPQRYELDYLIDPDLGGSDDARNLWPQPYSAEWNAHVKDALEKHLRELVCQGEISLEQAQQDISMDWISAYKKYFHTDHPIADHLAYVKDRPWE